MLYFFFAGLSVVISHGIMKEDKVPVREIDRAIERKKAYERMPQEHTVLWESPS
jgi:hypothetical protein